MFKLTPPDSTGEDRELAFIDPRRLARLRLVPDPVLSHPPLSQLGFDPVLNHPTLDEFKELIAKKRGTIKGLIMDQAFSAGVGNWVADEVLYQARIHPQHPVPDLEEQQIIALHRLLREVPLKACEVNADSSQFPVNWLFRWRWGKGGKKKKKVAVKSTAAGVKVETASFLALVGVSLVALPDPSPTAARPRSRLSPSAVAPVLSSLSSKSCRPRTAQSRRNSRPKRPRLSSANEMSRTAATPKSRNRPSSAGLGPRSSGRAESRR